MSLFISVTLVKSRDPSKQSLDLNALMPGARGIVFSEIPDDDAIEEEVVDRSQIVAETTKFHSPTTPDLPPKNRSVLKISVSLP